MGNFNEVLTIIIKAFAPIVIAIIGYLVRKFLANKENETKMNQLYLFVQKAVSAADQLFKNDTASDKDDTNYEKFTYVMAYVTSKAKQIGLNLSEDDLEILIESVVGEKGVDKLTQFAGKMAQITKFTSTIVAALEQTITGEGLGEAKKEKAIKYITEKANDLGLELTKEDMDILIEAAVYELNKIGKSTPIETGVISVAESDNWVSNINGTTDAVSNDITGSITVKTASIPEPNITTLPYIVDNKSTKAEL